MRGSHGTTLQKQQIAFSLTPTIKAQESTRKATQGFRLDK